MIPKQTNRCERKSCLMIERALHSTIPPTTLTGRKEGNGDVINSLRVAKIGFVRCDDILDELDVVKIDKPLAKD